MARYILNCGFGEIIDHINHDTLDNRRQNLRKCTGTQNKTNSKIYRNNKSGFKGVHWHKRDGTWGASIGYNGKQIHIGYFATLEEAARAYNETARQLHGEFAYLNAISG
jgi:hypothetical protein